MGNGSFEFSHEISAEEIERFLACPNDTPVVVWSLQKPGAVIRLRERGCLTGDPYYTFEDAKPGKRAAYEWMRLMMAKRVIDYQNQWPIWCSLSRRKPTNTEADRPLRFEIPKSRLLISFYLPWESLLSVMAFLEKRNMQWPAQWPYGQYASPKLNPIKKIEVTNDQAPVPFPSTFDEPECRSSWEQIFDLTLSKKEGFQWWWKPDCLQAMVPVVYLSELKETN